MVLMDQLYYKMCVNLSINKYFKKYTRFNCPNGKIPQEANNSQYVYLIGKNDRATISQKKSLNESSSPNSEPSKVIICSLLPTIDLNDSTGSSSSNSLLK